MKGGRPPVVCLASRVGGPAAPLPTPHEVTKSCGFDGLIDSSEDLEETQVSRGKTRWQV